MRLNDITSFWPGDYEQFLKCHCGFTKKVTKIYCEVNKSNRVKSRVTLDKTTSLQVKVFSQNSTSLHANYLK